MFKQIYYDSTGDPLSKWWCTKCNQKIYVETSYPAKASRSYCACGWRNDEQLDTVALLYGEPPEYWYNMRKKYWRLRDKLHALSEEAMHDMPEPHLCCICAKIATLHMPETGYSGEGWYCSKCTPGYK